MNPPKSVRVGPHVYKVLKDDRTAQALRDESKYGITKVDRLEIHLDPNVAHTQVADTLLHEILHCIWDQSGLREDQSLEESVICSITTELLNVLRSNPKVTKFLLSED